MFDWLLKTSFVQNYINSEVRHAATFLSGLALAWLLSHGFANDQAANIATGIASVVIGLAGYLLSKLNASNTAAVTTVAAQTGVIVPVPQARALIKGQTVILDSGQTLTIGKPSPAGTTADDLMKAELSK